RPCLRRETTTSLAIPPMRPIRQRALPFRSAPPARIRRQAIRRPAVRWPEFPESGRENFRNLRPSLPQQDVVAVVDLQLATRLERQLPGEHARWVDRTQAARGGLDSGLRGRGQHLARDVLRRLELDLGVA